MFKRLPYVTSLTFLPLEFGPPCHPNPQNDIPANRLLPSEDVCPASYVCLRAPPSSRTRVTKTMEQANSPEICRDKDI